MPTPSRKQEQSARTRTRLVDAATDLFAARGYREVSVRAIGEAAGVSRGSIFWHFGSKEALLWAVVERAFARWETEALVPAVGDATGVEAAVRAVEAHRRFLESDPQALRLLFVLMFEALGPRPELAGRFADLHARLRRMGGEWLARGATSTGKRAVEPEIAALLITGALGGIVYQHLLDPDGFSLPAAYDGLTTMIADGLA